MIKETNESKDSYWKDVIARLRASGLTQHQFCTQELVSKHKLKYWLKKLSVESSSGFEITKVSKSKESNFIEFERPIDIISEESPNEVNNQKLELSLPHGIVLKVWG